MKKIYSSDGSLAPVVCLNRYQDKWAIRWNRETVEPEEGMEEENVQYSYLQEDFDHKPTLQEIKDVVLGWVDAQTDAKILNGYEFTTDGSEEPIVVWLSKESQTNFSEAHRLQVVPVKFKLNEDEEKNAIYHTFTTFAELDRFYKGGVAWIQQCLNEGWTEKDSIDWEPYKEIFDEE